MGSVYSDTFGVNTSSLLSVTLATEAVGAFVFVGTHILHFAQYIFSVGIPVVGPKSDLHVGHSIITTYLSLNSISNTSDIAPQIAAKSHKLIFPLTF